MASSLRAELLAIEGIASAELEGNEEAPQGVRVQLAAGADAESVGMAVEKVLAEHGMRSHLAGDEAEPAGVQQPAANTPRLGPPPPPGAGGDAAIVPLRGLIGASTDPVIPMTTAPPQLESVAVEERRDGIAVRMVVGGETVSRQVGSGPDGMDAAIVAAMAHALDMEAELIAIQRGEAGEAKIITALLDVAGRGQQVGSSVVVAGEAYALAQAVWKALTAPE